MATPHRPRAVLVQLSDVHIGSRLAAHGASADAALARAVHAVRALDVPPDLVVVSGDLTDHGSPDEYERLVGALRGLPAPFVLMPGNHDDRGALRAALGPHQVLADGLDTITFAIDVGPVRLLALDSLVPGVEGGHVGGAQCSWLDAELGRDDRPAVVAVHHPPVPVGHAGLDTMFLDDADELGAVVERHRHVERVVCGHVHRPITVRWRGTTVTTAPSAIRQFAPTFADRFGFAVTDERPAMAVHLWVDGRLVSHVVSWSAEP